MAPLRLILLSLLIVLLTMFSSHSLWAKMFVCENNQGENEFTNVRQSSNCASLKNGKHWLKDTVVERDFSNIHKYTRSSWNNPDRYDNYIRRYGIHHKIDPFLIKAVIRAESDFDRYAVSSKGAQGLMQLMPLTAEKLRVKNPFDPQANIDGGSRYLKQMLDLFRGDVKLALAAYNAGPTLVKKKNRVPAIPETVEYVRKVLLFYKLYRNNIAAALPTRSVINIGKLLITN